ncbi:MAG: hypothetical protein U0893_16855 [Chloroflexota bacterium]
MAIGLFFVYLVLSMICSSINELLASLLKWRSQNLEASLAQLIQDPEARKKLFSHPLIAALGSKTLGTSVPWLSWPTKGWFVVNAHGKPSYIPSRAFATAFLDSLTPGSGAEISAASLHTAAQTLLSSTKVVGDATVDDDEKRDLGRVVAALLGESRDPTRLARHVDDVKQLIAASPPADPNDKSQFDALVAQLLPLHTLGEVGAAVDKLSDGPMKRALADTVNNANAFLLDVEVDLKTLHRNVQNWFDDAMERATGVYKRGLQIVLLFIALVVCGLFGADSLRIVSVLSVNSSLRAALVQQATAQTGQNGPSSQSTAELAGQLMPYTDLFGWDDWPKVAQGQHQAEGVWYFSPAEWDGARWRWLGFRLAGILTTVVAVSQGAPFWFDLLGKVVNLRGSGKPPQTAAERDQASAVVVATGS